jgi:pimeloyl-ACP methyl ester carboxylesterase
MHVYRIVNVPIHSNVSYFADYVSSASLNLQEVADAVHGDRTFQGLRPDPGLHARTCRAVSRPEIVLRHGPAIAFSIAEDVGSALAPRTSRLPAKRKLSRNAFSALSRRAINNLEFGLHAGVVCAKYSLGENWMTIVLVHGNPETEAIWDDLLPHLRDDDIVRLSPPGYGTPIPQGFDCSVDAYRDWLASELKKLAQPIDLVGHDWGGGHVVRIAMDCPTLIRSWTSDALGAFDKDYVWHDLAQVWQTPEAGEQAVQQMLSTPSEARAQRYETLGITPAIAQKVAAGTDRDMGRAILALSRSAAQPVMRDLGIGLPRANAKPGLALIATEDTYGGGQRLARRSAERAGAKIAVLKGAGHWWMCQNRVLMRSMRSWQT